jgi:hypothetical protein
MLVHRCAVPDVVGIGVGTPSSKRRIPNKGFFVMEGFIRSNIVV